MNDDDERPRAGVLLARGVVFLLVSALLFSGCALRQALRRPQLAGVSLAPLPRWVMFSGSGIGLTQYRFEMVDETGARAPVDPYAVLELDPLEQPRRVWRVRGPEQLRRLGRRLCARLRAQRRAQGLGPVQLRVTARTGALTGWRPERRLEARDLCARRRARRP
ncbi:MAG: hypothetical protein H6713_01475 [Myxococcales bacterium]|nr:hypothetical protein [Myxococcales bacterium]